MVTCTAAPSVSSASSFQSYETLVQDHRRAFERLARRLSRSPEDAEDLLQETLIDAYRSFHRYRQDGHFYSWVARIMTNNHLDHLRRNRLQALSLDQFGTDDEAETFEVPDYSADPEGMLLWEQLDHRLQAALDSLQPIHRATVELCDLAGATYEEAAAAQDCPIGTIRSRLHRAHRYLQHFLAALPEPNREAGELPGSWTLLPA